MCVPNSFRRTFSWTKITITQTILLILILRTKAKTLHQMHLPAVKIPAAKTQEHLLIKTLRTRADNRRDAEKRSFFLAI